MCKNKVKMNHVVSSSTILLNISLTWECLPLSPRLFFKGILGIWGEHPTTYYRQHYVTSITKQPSITLNWQCDSSVLSQGQLWKNGICIWMSQPLVEVPCNEISCYTLQNNGSTSVLSSVCDQLVHNQSHLRCCHC